ncbi:protein of unknown function [Bartonella clarridgeiae 73]|uniref:Uncharacterized protein n=1 Tax=Bartonella clarridgeiae (strain CCUG 45776 / CIP 104772 / 73) TaxID=696125 RepID=E6YGS9_BARC7|nr:protein of unknown function [Bartonella clarridgeiae 73]
MVDISKMISCDNENDITYNLGQKDKAFYRLRVASVCDEDVNENFVFMVLYISEKFIIGFMMS